MKNWKGETHRTGISGNSSDNKQEIESDDELSSEGLTNADGRDGDPTGEERVVNAFESEAGTDGGGDLSCDVGRDMGPREVAKGSEGDCEGWVEVCA